MTSDPAQSNRGGKRPACPSLPCPQAGRLRLRVVRLALLSLIALATLTVIVLLLFRRERITSPQLKQGFLPEIMWTFEQPESGAIVSAPIADGEHVYFAAIHDNALAPSGVVYCLDRRRGTPRWTFDDDGAMRQTISTPCLAGGRLYVGEGMHGNDVCKMYCLDAASGRKLWQFVSGGHIESSPCVAAGAVFFGSGDDGLYCLDAASGTKRWQFVGRWHIDVSPVVVEGRVYAGSGVSRLYRTQEIFCLDAASGRPLWRTPSELPVWGSPVVDGGQVFFGTGTGRLTRSAEPPEKPTGALLCADTATGRICWTAHLADAVFCPPVVDAERVYFGCRDGRCYCLDRRDGRRNWQTDLGSPIVTRPALADGRLVVVASGGRIACLDADNGQAVWTFDLASHTQTRPQLLSSPLIVGQDEATGGRFMYFGSELKNGVRSAAVLYCLCD